uniref:Uncharacterized protein n=1 Tax=Steinernema glaseri TaxID=37863 RepID=A0A1I7ZSJ1_9BILA
MAPFSREAVQVPDEWPFTPKNESLFIWKRIRPATAKFDLDGSASTGGVIQKGVRSQETGKTQKEGHGHVANSRK